MRVRDLTNQIQQNDNQKAIDLDRLNKDFELREGSYKQKMSELNTEIEEHQKSKAIQN